MKLNLGTVPTVANVYNKITSDNGQNISINNEGVAGQTSDQIDDKLVVRTQYVTSFRDRLNVKAAISPAKIQNINDAD